MARIVALADHSRTVLASDLLRSAIVCACALALIGAGPFAPFGL